MCVSPQYTRSLCWQLLSCACEIDPPLDNVRLYAAPFDAGRVLEIGPSTGAPRRPSTRYRETLDDHSQVSVGHELPRLPVLIDDAMVRIPEGVTPEALGLLLHEGGGWELWWVEEVLDTRVPLDDPEVEWSPLPPQQRLEID